MQYIAGIRYLDRLLNNKYLYYFYQPREIAGISIQFVKNLVGRVDTQRSQKTNQGTLEQISFQRVIEQDNRKDQIRLIQLGLDCGQKKTVFVQELLCREFYSIEDSQLNCDQLIVKYN